MSQKLELQIIILGVAIPLLSGCGIITNPKSMIPSGAKSDSSRGSATELDAKTGDANSTESQPIQESPTPDSSTSLPRKVLKLTGIFPNIGLSNGRTPVTLKGSGFVTGTDVFFDDVICVDTKIISDSEMSCTAPIHAAGLATVVVVNSEVRSTPLVSGFTYISPLKITSVNPSFARTTASTLLTIQGAGFLPETTVKAGDTACGSVTVLSPTKLICTLPAHAAASVNLAIANSDGQSDVLRMGVSFLDAPTLTTVTPSFGSLGGGTPITLVGSGFLPDLVVSVGGAQCTSVHLESSSRMTCKTPAHTVGAAVDVSIVNIDDQSVKLQSAYTYQPAPGALYYDLKL